MLSNFNTFANFLELASYEMLLQQASNDDLLKELRHQNNEYFAKILENQTEIIRRLERLENERLI